MNVLAIGNSFSQDATRYLHDIAKADGTDMTVVNLYIGGCSLETHRTNLLFNDKRYVLEFNGVSTGIFVTAEEVLRSRRWDVVTLQQASHYSTDYATYAPYLAPIAKKVRQCAPGAKLFIHETWAYEEGSERIKTIMGFDSRHEMYEALRDAYAKAAREIDADGIIPAGMLFEKLQDEAGMKVHRDTFHASYGLGRYALGMVWYKALTGRSVRDIAFDETDEAVDANELAAARVMADELV